MNKLLLSVMATVALAFSSAASAQTNNRFSEPVIKRVQNTQDDFQPALRLVFSQMLKSYQKEVKEPLRIDVLNVNNEHVQRFFDEIHSEHRGLSYDPHSILSLSYSHAAKINNKPTSACLVRYNSKDRMQLLSGYEKSGIFNKESILYYLAAHEFGHCMVMHQLNLKGEAVDLKTHELLADKAAMAFFATNGKMEVAKQIIEFNKKLVSGELHSHHEELEKYYERLKWFFKEADYKEVIGSMYGVYQLAVDL